MGMQRGDIDYLMLGALLALAGFGFLMSYGVSSHLTAAAEKFSFDRLFFFKRELARLLVAGTVMAAAVAVNFRKLRWSVVPLFAASLALLLLTALSGTTVRGSRGWLFGLQTGELARFALVLFLARTMAGRENEMARPTRELTLSLAAVAAVTAAVMLQRDYGSAAAVGGMGMAMLLAGGANLLVWSSSMALGGLGFVIAALARPHIMARVRGFWMTLSDPGGIAAAAATADGHLRNTLSQVHQSLLAIGSGGPLGVGLGQSRQKLLFVPEAHTDFIFSIMAEEGGLVFGLLVLSLFLFLLWRGFRTAGQLGDPFERLAVIGFSSGIFIYAAINISVAMGLFPVTGLPLPFISYGGSALVFNVAAVGLMLNFSRHRGHQCFQTYARRINETAGGRRRDRRASLSRAGGRR